MLGAHQASHPWGWHVAAPFSPPHAGRDQDVSRGMKFFLSWDLFPIGALAPDASVLKKPDMRDSCGPQAMHLPVPHVAHLEGKCAEVIMHLQQVPHSTV